MKLQLTTFKRTELREQSGHNFRVLSCTPTYLNAPIFLFLRINSGNFGVLLGSNLLIIDADKNV